MTPHREDRSIATRLKVESSTSFSRKQLSVVHIRYQSYHTPHILILGARQQHYTVCSQSHLTLHVHVSALFTHAPYHTYTHRRTLDDVDEILSLVSRPRLQDCTTQLVLNLLLTRPCTRLTRRHCSKPPPTTSPHTVTRTAADCYYGRRHCYRGRRGEHRHEQMHARSATRETRLHGTRVPRACPSFETTVCHRAASENLHAKYLTCKPPPHPIMHPTHTSSLQQDRQPPRRRPIHCHSYCSRLLLYGHAVSRRDPHSTLFTTAAITLCRRAPRSPPQT